MLPRLEAVYQAIADGVVVFDEHGQAIMVNQAEAKLCGYDTPEELLQGLDYFQRVYELRRLDGSVLSVEEWPVSRVMSGEVISGLVLDTRRLDTGQRWIIEFSGRPVRDEHGHQSMSVIISRDVTVEYTARESLARSEERLRLAKASASLGVFDYDLVTGKLEWDARLRELWGLADDEPVNIERFWEGLHPDDREHTRLRLEVALVPERADKYDAEYRVVNTRDGKTRWIHAQGRVSIENGVPVRMVGIVQDVTERRLNEDRLQRNQETFARLIEGNPFGVYVVDADFRLSVISIGARKVFSNVRPLIGRDFAEILRVIWPEPDASEFIARFRHTLATGEPHVERGTMASRRDIEAVETYDWRIERVSMPDGRYGVVCYFYDLSERQQMEAALRESGERFRHLAEAMPQLVWTALSDGTVTYYNSQVSRFSGVIQTPAGSWHWQPMLHPDDLESTTRAWMNAVETGSLYQSEHRIRMSDGTFRWHLSRAHLVPGDPPQWFGTATDIHDLKLAQEELDEHRGRLQQLVEQRTAQLEQTHERLRVSERMSALGTLSAGLGHDLGNMLVPLGVWIAELQRADLPESAKQSVEGIAQSVQYFRSLTTGLRSLSLDPEEAGAAPGMTRLDEWWESTKGVFKAALPRGVSISVQGLNTSPIVAIPAHALTQAVFNLVQNAGDAMRERGRGVITISARAHPSEAHRVVLSVSDDGPGMTEEIRRRCMEPFFTTKSRVRGTGLGLALVYAILARYAGAAEIESAPGAGTTFHLTLNAVQSAGDGVRPRVAVTIRDQRLGAIVRGVLTSLDTDVEITAPGALPSPECRGWVVDDQTLVDEANGSLGHRRVIVVGPASAGATTARSELGFGSLRMTLAEKIAQIRQAPGAMDSDRRE